MPDFKAKMHQIRFRLGLRPRPRWGSLQRSLAGSRGPTSKGRSGEGGEGNVGRGGEGRGGGGGEGSRGEGKGKVVPPMLETG